MPPDAATRRAALGLYAPQTWLGLVLRFNMRRGWLSTGRIGLAESRVAGFLAAVEDSLGEVDLRVAFSVGPPRPTQKITAALIGRDSSIRGYAKVAFSGEARAALGRERRVLQEISDVRPLSAHIPSIRAWLQWEEADVLVLSPGPVTAGPGVLGNTHFSFLQLLHEASQRESDFELSPIRQRLSRKHEKLGGRLAHGWDRRYERAIDRVDRVLGSVRMPTCLAHRDFTPWNTRTGDLGLFVFDWELAEDGTIPGYDAFHFRAIQAALMGRPVDLDNWIPGFVESVWPGGGELLSDLWLTYLVDTSMDYAEARAITAGVGDHRVLDWFATEIDGLLEGLGTGSGIASRS